MAKTRILPGRRVAGEIEPPGDKSISHRYAILAALAEGTSTLQHYSDAADCRSTLECLRELGAQVETRADGVSIQGSGLRGLKPPRRALDAGNSGTTMRLLAGVLAAQEFASTLTGDASLRRRPMRRILEPLGQMGARIRARQGGFAPLKIQGSRLQAIDYKLPIASAQVKSALLLAGLFADGETSVEEPVRTRDHLELALREFGVDVERSGQTVRIRRAQRLHARSFAVPGDLSAAVFFLGAALVLPGSDLVIESVGLNPTRSHVLDVLIAMGAPIRLHQIRMRNGELAGQIAVRHASLQGGRISGEEVPQLIDELPTLAALGPFTEKGIEIRDAEELRVKESDRIAALAEGLRRMGAQVEESPDGLRVQGRAAGRLRGASVDPHGDHRIAMALAVAALGAESETTIRDSECVGISYPRFFETLERVVER